MVEELKDVTDSLELIPVTDLEIGFALKAAEIEIQGKEVLEQALVAYQKNKNLKTSFQNTLNLLMKQRLGLKAY